MGSGIADQLVYVWIGVGWKNVPSIRDLRSSSVSLCHQWHLVQRHRGQMAAAVSPWQQSLVGVTHVEGFMHRFDLFNVTTYCATYSQLDRVLMISAPIPRHHDAFCEMTARGTARRRPGLPLPLNQHGATPDQTPDGDEALD